MLIYVDIFIQIYMFSWISSLSNIHIQLQQTQRETTQRKWYKGNSRYLQYTASARAADEQQNSQRDIKVGEDWL